MRKKYDSSKFKIFTYKKFKTIFHFFYLHFTWLCGSRTNQIILLLKQSTKCFDPVQKVLNMSQIDLDQYRGSPTYGVFTIVDPTTEVFGLCTHKWGIFVLAGDPLQSH